MYQLEPWGEEKDDLQHAYTRKVIAEVFGAKSKSGKGLSIYDMSMERLRASERERRRARNEPAEPKQSVDEMKNILQSIASVTKANKGQVSPAQKARRMNPKRRKR